MTDLLPRLRAWTRARLLLDRSGADIPAVLERVVGVYSSHPSAPLSLLCRLPSLEAQQVTGLDARREWLRIPAMRGSIFAVPTGDAASLLAANAFPLEKLGRRLKIGGTDRAGYEAIKPRLLEQLRQPRTPKELQEAVPFDGRLMALVRVMAFEGLMLRISDSLRTDKLRYVATEAWLGRALESVDPDEAFARLAHRYLDAFGPARLVDFAWWAGTTKGRANRALAALDTVEVASGLLLLREHGAAFAATGPLSGDEIDVLPKWDPLTMGYAGDGRQRLVDDAHAPAILSHLGDGLPLLLRGGRAVAVWSRRFQGKRLMVTVKPLAGESVALDDYADRLEEVGRLLGATSTRVVLAR